MATLLTPSEPEDLWDDLDKRFRLIAANGILEAYREGRLNPQETVKKIGLLLNNFDRIPFLEDFARIIPIKRVGKPNPMTVFKGMTMAITEVLVESGYSLTKPGVYDDKNNAFVAASKFLKAATIDVSPATIASWWYK